MPQSPRWLITHGYDEEGLRVIAALAGSSMEDPLVLEQKRMSESGRSARSETSLTRPISFGVGQGCPDGESRTQGIARSRKEAELAENAHRVSFLYL